MKYLYVISKKIGYISYEILICYIKKIGYISYEILIVILKNILKNQLY